jgi:ABC-type antimicrobial peptide transport system permease subunit
MARVIVVLGTGLVLGGLLSAAAATLIATLVFGLGPRDPQTFVGATVILAVVALVAGGLPAWRASQIDPAEVLRESQVAQNGDLAIST